MEKAHGGDISKSRTSSKTSIAKRTGMALLMLIVAGLLVPERLLVPVDGATVSDWSEDTYWYEPWGASGVHKGIDIFASKGKHVLAATGGIVVFQGSNRLGGNVILVLGPKWRVHYYAHMKSSIVSSGDFVSRGEVIGLVGDSGNASGKPSHLHYVILSVIPHPWLADTRAQGWKKMFYLDPNTRLRADLAL